MDGTLLHHGLCDDRSRLAESALCLQFIVEAQKLETQEPF